MSAALDLSYKVNPVSTTYYKFAVSRSTNSVSGSYCTYYLFLTAVSTTLSYINFSFVSGVFLLRSLFLPLLSVVLASSCVGFYYSTGGERFLSPLVFLPDFPGSDYLGGDYYFFPRFLSSFF